MKVASLYPSAKKSKINIIPKHAHPNELRENLLDNPRETSPNETIGYRYKSENRNCLKVRACFNQQLLFVVTLAMHMLIIVTCS